MRGGAAQKSLTYLALRGKITRMLFSAARAASRHDSSTAVCDVGACAGKNLFIALLAGRGMEDGANAYLSARTRCGMTTISKWRSRWRGGDNGERNNGAEMAGQAVVANGGHSYQMAWAGGASERRRASSAVCGRAPSRRDRHFFSGVAVCGRRRIDIKKNRGAARLCAPAPAHSSIAHLFAYLVCFGCGKRGETPCGCGGDCGASMECRI